MCMCTHVCMCVYLIYTSLYRYVNKALLSTKGNASFPRMFRIFVPTSLSFYFSFNFPQLPGSIFLTLINHLYYPQFSPS